jgi:hypothetical protein
MVLDAIERQILERDCTWKLSISFMFKFLDRSRRSISVLVYSIGQDPSR